MTGPILDIATLIERPMIAIDGEHYEIRSHEELSVIDHWRLSANGRQLDELMKRGRLEKAEQKTLSKLVQDISNFIMVGVPDDVRDKLTDFQRIEISEVFTAMPLRKHLTAAMKAAEAEAKSTGAKPRPGSKGSTAGRRTGGSTKRRSRSSKRTSK